MTWIAAVATAIAGVAALILTFWNDLFGEKAKRRKMVQDLENATHERALLITRLADVDAAMAELVATGRMDTPEFRGLQDIRRVTNAAIHDTQCRIDGYMAGLK